MSSGTQPLFQIFVLTTSRSSKALSAHVDTRFFAQGDSRIRDPTVLKMTSIKLYQRKESFLIEEDNSTWLNIRATSAEARYHIVDVQWH